jgi:hypothetical protein
MTSDAHGPVISVMLAVPDAAAAAPVRGAPAASDQVSIRNRAPAGALFALPVSERYRTWPRISPPGKSPGPVSGGATPSLVCTLT